LKTIGIDYTPAYEQGGGIGRYVRELVTALLALDEDAVHYKLFVAGAKQHDPRLLPNAKVTWKTTRLSPKWLARLWQRAQIPIPIETFIGRTDIFHATDFVLPPNHTRTILTVHDLSFVRVPEAASPRLRAFLDKVVPRSVQRADHILADSIATKQDLVNLYHTLPEKITVLYSGVETRFQRIANVAHLDRVRAKYHLSSTPFIFSVGTVQPRKNYSRLIQAVARLRNAGMDIDLVIAGGRGWLENPIYQAVADNKLPQHVHFIGFVDDDDLPALYSLAHLTALPSLYEGFGIPVLESMACGTPVLTSNISSLPEVAGDAALTITPTNLDELCENLTRLVTDDTLRKLLIERGYEQAKQFTWTAAAQQLQLIYRRFL